MNVLLSTIQSVFHVWLLSLAAFAQKPVPTVQAGHSQDISSIAFSPNGRTLASASQDDTVKLWDVASGRELRTLGGHTSWVTSVAFSPDGRTVASGSQDETVKLWDAATGRERRTLNGHAGSVHSVAFSPDGRKLAVGADYVMVQIWDLASGTIIQKVEDLLEKGSSLAFSGDGRTLAVASVHKVKLLDIVSGIAGTLEMHSDYIDSVSISRDGRLVAAGGDDHCNT